ncbi:MAG: glucosaminidase domain-containing protein [Thiohalophilus sp.]|uniref:glucosaminidase domain-containing protein n=1 Tax=Thiohalophilus sp. TaxID=3028392 RepID=UPI0028701893|nr:glucosaminidase domain-containing protein [Thiohalophilus sp.]MDR9435370.1 glucosaminidase domain-containing protein [Thiohalophilus sp.]
MNLLLKRLAEGARAIGRQPLLARSVAALRRALAHLSPGRLGAAIVARLPGRIAGRIRTVESRHPNVVGRAVVVCVGMLILAMAWFSYDHLRVSQPGNQSLPDFRVFENSGDRKEAFIEFLWPVVKYENRRVLAKREKLLAILDKLEDGEHATPDEQAWLAKQAQLYRVKAKGKLERARKLATRVDIVPTSLALSQAALESAWGTSRFARQGNNLFGQWCFTAGCGIVPRRRPERATFEVQAFDTIAGSVRTYLRNLNSHPAYQPLRDIRAQARKAGREPSGLEMAAGLINYAAIGEDYVKHIRGVIRRNDLDRLDSAG